MASERFITSNLPGSRGGFIKLQFSTMALDDKLEKLIDHLESAGRQDVGKEILAAAAGMFPLSSALEKLISGLAQRRLVERMVEVFQEIKSQLDATDEALVRADYFMTEEFQTLLTLVLQEIQTTHDRAKLRMLAASLSNSCLTKFRSETRKELFVRTLRSLSPEHIQVLNSLSPTHFTYEEFTRSRLSLSDFVNEDGYWLGRLEPTTPTPWRSGPIKAFPVTRGPKGESLLLLQSLTASGLVEEMIVPGIAQTKVSESKRGMEVFWTGLNPQSAEAPSRCFKLSLLGEQFLAFVSKGRI